MVLIVESTSAYRTMVYNLEGNYNAAFIAYDAVKLVELDMSQKIVNLQYDGIIALIQERVILFNNSKYECKII